MHKTNNTINLMRLSKISISSFLPFFIFTVHNTCTDILVKKTFFYILSFKTLKLTGGAEESEGCDRFGRVGHAGSRALDGF
jgi:hypothetical protein